MRSMILFIMLVVSLQATAQLTGKVKDAAGAPVAGASVTLRAANDSVDLGKTITDSTGHFILQQIKQGSYKVMISGSGFKPFFSDAVSVTGNAAVEIPAITLTANTKETLASVTVISKKTLIERRADKTILNVDAMLSNTGSNALEVLANAPGVQVDNNETIILKGKQGVMIYIDDKPSWLSGADLANYLKSLPASMLDKIEIMTTPPAKYDAAGNAGVINIRTKKSKLKGFNGNLSLSFRQGIYGDSRNSLNFNYRKNALNIFTNISGQGGNNFNDLYIRRQYNDAGGNLQSSFEQNTFTKRSYTSFTGKIGADYSVNKKVTIGLVLSALERPSNEKRTSTGIFSNKLQAADSVILADNHEEEKFSNKSINLNFRNQIDSNGREFTMDADYLRYKTTNSQLYKNTGLNADMSPKFYDQLIGDLPSFLDIYSFKSDYTHPLDKKSKLEAGIKTSYISTDNNALYFISAANIVSPDYDKTNHFIYKENINAAYLNYSRDMKRVSLQFGLRAENTVSKGHQLGNLLKPDSAFKKTYTDLFPTVFASYKLDSAGNNQLNFSYSKRIDRPYYQDLNPFISPLDKFTYYAGNPFLKPQYTQHFEFAHSYKSKINTTISYDHIKDGMDETIELAGSTFISRTGNISNKNMIGINVDATINPTKWWTILPYAEMIYTHTQSKVYTESVDTKAVFWQTSATNQFRFTKGWSAEIFSRYRSHILDGQFDSKAYSQVNVSAMKKVMKDQGSFKILFIDIFRTRSNRGDISGLKGGTGYYNNKFDTRALVLAFTYRFSKGAKSSEQRKTGGAEAEQNRVKN